jgi:hypothetical protein
VRFGDRVISANVPEGPRNQLVNGTWDSTALLLEAGAAIEATAKKLAYVSGYWSAPPPVVAVLAGYQPK